MKNWFRMLLLTLLLGAFPAIDAAESNDLIIIEPLSPSAESEIVHDLASGLTVATNGVIIRYGPTVLIADQVSLNERTGEVSAQGHVILQSEERFWRGEKLDYNFQTGGVQAENFRLGLAPLYATGQGLSFDRTNQVYVAREAFLTTDDVMEPGYRIRARKMTFVPGKLIQAEHATLYAGGLPVMYFPHFSRSLERHPNHFTFTPGYRSLYGPFLLGAYRWEWSTNLSGAFNLDFRERRGVGFGPDLAYKLGPWGQGDLSGYYIEDQDPGADEPGRVIRSDRYRVEFSHRAAIRTNLTAAVVAQKQSDAFMSRDFFEPDHRRDPQPKSFLELRQGWSNFSLNVLGQPQLNDFFQTVERLPDVKLSGFRQQLGVSPLYYEGETSAAYLRFRPEEGSLTNDYAALRADTFHQLLLPQTFFGWLNVTPRAGGRFTYYTESEGSGAVWQEEDRGVFNTGAEVSWKASRVWNQARSRFWEVNELRHIVQPSFNYVFVPSPTKAPYELPQFDSEVPSLRLLPIDFPDFNSIDSIDSQNVLRLSLRNKVQTKRREEVDNLINWALFTDWRIDPRADQTTFSDFYSDLDFKPRSWMILSSEIRYDVEDGQLQTSNHRLTIQPKDIWHLSLGHRFFREDPSFGPLSGNNLFYSSAYYRFNENWAGRLTHHFEARDGVLEEQYYTLYRDLRSWTAALTFRVRERRVGPTDFTVAVMMSLKAFPRFKLGHDRDQHSLLLGG